MLRLMRRSFIAFLMVSGVMQVRENPQQPVHPNPDRVLKLVEALKIKGEGKGYYFEGARTLEIDPIGNLYACDSWSSARRSHLMKFSPEGRFIKDLYRQGEGPGEILSTFDFTLSGSEMFLYDTMKRKIVVMDTDGNFKTEFKKETAPFDELIGAFGDWLVILRVSRPLERQTSRLYDEKNAIIMLSKDGKTEKDIFMFTNRSFYISPTQGGGGMSWDPFHSAIAGDRIYVCSTQNYQIQVLDMAKANILFSFMRAYPRVEHLGRDWEKKFATQYNAPKRNYENDVKGLIFGGGRLWVRTSLESKDKGALYDLFNSDGRFVDSFFVDSRVRIIKIDDDFLYASVSDENELPFLVKYRIGEPIGAR